MDSKLGNYVRRLRQVVSWIDKQTEGWMDGWMDGWMYGWMDAWMDGWMDR